MKTSIIVIMDSLRVTILSAGLVLCGLTWPMSADHCHDADDSERHYHHLHVHSHGGLIHAHDHDNHDERATDHSDCDHDECGACHGEPIPVPLNTSSRLAGGAAGGTLTAAAHVADSAIDDQVLGNAPSSNPPRTIFTLDSILQLRTIVLLT